MAGGRRGKDDKNQNTFPLLIKDKIYTRTIHTKCMARFKKLKLAGKGW